MGERGVARVEWDGIASVRTTLVSGEVMETEKLLCALGRVANVTQYRPGATPTSEVASAQ